MKTALNEVKPTIKSTKKPMKGIILAGGSGTRLYPLTIGITKQLLPVYDKPMIYYPLSALMMAGIRDILIISTLHDQENFKRLLGDGSHLGCRFSYALQHQPTGLAHAFLIGEEFIADHPVALVLGDNIFFGEGLEELLQKSTNPDGAIVFAAEVPDPNRYGVVTFDKNMRALSVEEKPENPRSNYAVTGLYFYDNDVVSLAREVKPSARGEYEITSINEAYLQRGALSVEVLSKGMAYFDAGTFQSLSEAGRFVQEVQEEQGCKIGCVEEIAFTQGFIDANQLYSLALRLKKSGYGTYLEELVKLNNAPAFTNSSC